MSTFHVLSALVTVAALASYLNHRFLRLPTTIGLMAISLAIAVAVAGADRAGLFAVDALADTLQTIDFTELLLHGMLAFLLFAGALHVDASELRKHAAPIAALATVGVVLTCMVAAALMWGLAALIGMDLPFAYALLFGALIAPTDPIAVLAIMRKANAPASIGIRITGESLFNDGIGVVLFLTVLEFAEGPGETTVAQIAMLLTTEIVGGLAVGAALGWLTYRLLRTVDQYDVEVLLTVALAAGAYTVADVLHVSAPIAAVVAGLVIGNHGRTHAMSRTTRRNVDMFWGLIDELLNAVLFVLIGLEVLVLNVAERGWQIALLAIGAVPAVLLARAVSVSLPAPFLGIPTFASRVAVFTWAGLRGGISIALALSLADTPQRDALLVATYVVVVFSILVQGLTLQRLLVRLCPQLATSEQQPSAT